jgi:dTDP-4-dehydrorhamnose reductase
MADRILITGGGGQLASDLDALLSPIADVRAPARTDLDVTDHAAVEALFSRFQPDLVYNCAAFHNVDLCEREEARSFAVNATAVKRLAELATAHRAKLVHLSTNYVFDGSADEPYAEDDAPSPRSVYAISKLAGEHSALAYAPDSLIVRTAGLYGLHGSRSKGGNFVTRMVARAREQGSLRMVADQRLSPTFTGDLAHGLVDAVDRGASGLVHMTSSGGCSWFEFTAAIMELAGIDVTIEPVPTTVPAGGAVRPLNGVLASRAAETGALTPLRSWRDALAEYMERAGLVATVSA